MAERIRAGENKNKKEGNRATSAVIPDETLLALAKSKRGVIDARIILPSRVVTAAWVKMKCRFGCDGYGQCLVCPPYTPSDVETRRMLDGYRRAILIHFRPRSGIARTIAGLEREIFLAGAWKAFGMEAGPCPFCQTCPVEDGLCRHPELARPAMEACGIDVYSTVRNSGFPIEVVRTRRQIPNYYGLILVD